MKWDEDGIEATMKWTLFLGVLLCILLAWFEAFAKELPVLVEVSELTDSYNGKRVALMGWSRSIEVKNGRMGSRYVKMLVTQDGASVTVFSSFPLYNILNNRVIVQGKYHTEGRFGGFLADHFIVAEQVLRDWK